MCAKHTLATSFASLAREGTMTSVVGVISCGYLLVVVGKRAAPIRPCAPPGHLGSRARRDRASATAFITEVSEPAQPASPQPFTPSTLVVAGTGCWMTATSGESLARGS